MFLHGLQRCRTLKRQTRVTCGWIYGCRPKSVSTGRLAAARLDACLVTHSGAKAAYAWLALARFQTFWGILYSVSKTIQRLVSKIKGRFKASLEFKAGRRTLIRTKTVRQLNTRALPATSKQAVLGTVHEHITHKRINNLAKSAAFFLSYLCIASSFKHNIYLLPKVTSDHIDLAIYSETEVKWK